MTRLALVTLCAALCGCPDDDPDSVPVDTADAGAMPDGSQTLTGDCLSIPEWIGPARLTDWGIGQSNLRGHWEQPMPGGRSGGCYVDASQVDCDGWYVEDTDCPTVLMGWQPPHAPSDPSDFQR